jgi:hypothetical protein
MGTHALIGRINADQSITSIYTNWDGYPEHHLPILVTHYATDESLSALLSLGDLSVLGNCIGEKHDIEDRSMRECCCTAYGRDGGEYGVDSQTSISKAEFELLCVDCRAKYAYLFDGAAWLPYAVSQTTKPHLSAYTLPNEAWVVDLPLRGQGSTAQANPA